MSDGPKERPGGSLPAPEESMPIAPSAAEWAGLSAEEKARRIDRINASLPIAVTMSEGTPHSRAKRRAAETLDSYFARTKRGVFIAEELSVLYPGEAVFVPDLLAVLDVPLHDRAAWSVLDEGKGPDLLLEIHSGPRSPKDTVTNVERYARLGVPEYFLYDCERRIVRGYRLDPGEPRRYVSVLPQGGRFASQVLGLELGVVDGRLRFFKDEAEILGSSDLVERLSRMVDERESRIEAAEAQAAAAAVQAAAAAVQAAAAAARAATAESQATAAAARGEAAAAQAETLRRTFRETLVAVLGERGLVPSVDEQARIESCAEPGLLSRWITRAVTARTVAEVLADTAAIGSSEI